MAAGRDYYTLERTACRTGYKRADVDGKIIKEAGAEGAASDWLSTAVDVEQVCADWRDGVPDADLRISSNAGRYLCEFIYYRSLAHFSASPGSSDVVFLHVPASVATADIQLGRKVVLSLVRILVKDRIRRTVGHDEYKVEAAGSWEP
ncbi:MAG: hypothetical protein M1825_001700 [Sarcosagium campestre]|nr:MAG: hypothetical protein M1825_001700 [Sarcosagium campestre]